MDARGEEEGQGGDCCVDVFATLYVLSLNAARDALNFDTFAPTLRYAVSFCIGNEAEYTGITGI